MLDTSQTIARGKREPNERVVVGSSSLSANLLNACSLTREWDYQFRSVFGNASQNAFKKTVHANAEG